jgi:hypothetical protein
VSALGAVVDGVALPDAEAVALWRRFSAWMEEHAGDLLGFAQAEGFASVRPEMHAGSPLLVVSRTAPQSPYTNATKRPDAPRPSVRRRDTGPRKKRR